MEHPICCLDFVGSSSFPYVALLFVYKFIFLPCMLDKLDEFLPFSSTMILNKFFSPPPPFFPPFSLFTFLLFGWRWGWCLCGCLGLFWFWVFVDWYSRQVPGYGMLLLLLQFSEISQLEDDQWHGCWCCCWCCCCFFLFFFLLSFIFFLFLNMHYLCNLYLNRKLRWVVLGLGFL